MSTEIFTKISTIIDELIEEKGIDKSVMLSILTESIYSIYEKKMPENKIEIQYDKKNDSIIALKIFNVVEKVENENAEISLKKAKSINTIVEIGETISIPIKEKFSRIEILKLKKIINQKIKEIECEAIYKDFINKKDTIINGTVHKVDETGAMVLVYGFNAFLPKSMMIEGESLQTGAPIRAIVKEVFSIPKIDGQILLDRSSQEFILKLLEIEIPEIFDGIVRVEKIVRISGYKTKILVSSRDSHINPVGTCIGMGGVRIRSILKELKHEKLDIIALSNKQNELIAQSLKPAEIEDVEVRGNTAYVTVDKEQKSIAVGKMGKNIILASQLTGLNIEIVESKK